MGSRNASSGSPPARPSASLILISPLSTPSRDGFDYRVCLLVRSKTMSVSPSVTVFPGGNLDAADTVAASSDPALSRIGGDAQLRALKVCALRETLEETGILVAGAEETARRDIDGAKVEAWRKRVYAKPDEYLSAYRDMHGASAVPPLDSLLPWSRWITPVGVPKRFDTTFFLHILPMPKGTEPGKRHPLLNADKGETASAEWVTPRQALVKCIERREIFLMPPQVYLLAELSRLPTLESIRTHAKSRDREPILPKMLRLGPRKGVSAFVYPGDEEYDRDLAAENAGKRHRTYSVSERNEKGKMVLVAPPVVRGLHRRGLPGMGDLAEGDVEDPAATEHPKL